jgi:regulator of replication initiation timing
MLTREQVEAFTPLASLEQQAVTIDGGYCGVYVALTMMIDTDAALRAENERLCNPLEHADHFTPQFIERDKQIADLTAQLAALRETWETIIQEIANNETVSPYIGPLWNMGWTERGQSLLKWCRAQAAHVVTEAP